MKETAVGETIFYIFKYILKDVNLHKNSQSASLVIALLVQTYKLIILHLTCETFFF